MSSTDNQPNFPPQKLFSRIMKCLPIVSVQAVIVTDDGLLLLKRKNKPAKGEWWFPGGRINKGESLHDALCREIKEETNLEISNCKLLNVYSRVFPELHDIAITYLCSSNSSNVVMNEEHSEYAFFKQLPHNLHPFVREVLEDSVREENQNRSQLLALKQQLRQIIKEDQV